jgi:hypothetical protein
MSAPQGPLHAALASLYGSPLSAALDPLSTRPAGSQRCVVAELSARVWWQRCAVAEVCGRSSLLSLRGVWSLLASLLDCLSRSGGWPLLPSLLAPTFTPSPYSSHHFNNLSAYSYYPLPLSCPPPPPRSLARSLAILPTSLSPPLSLSL